MDNRMGDISFTEMGQALDAATQLRADNNGVSSTPSTSGTPGHLSGNGPEGRDEGPSVPINGQTVASGKGASGEGSGASSTPPKTKTPPNDRTPDGDGKGGQVADNGGVNQNGSRSGSPDDKELAERKNRNQWFAAQRIAAKRAKQRRYDEDRERLQHERDEFADESSAKHNPQMASVKEDQLRELEISHMREAQMEWEKEAYEIFSPEDASAFIEDTKKLSDWLNTKEPELLSYLDKPYGKHMLKGWIDKIAKVPEMADQWERMNQYEKYKVIDKYYKELKKFGEDYAAGRVNEKGEPVGQPQSATPVQSANGNQNGNPSATLEQPSPITPNAPVPNSGRDTGTIPPSSNFGLMLQEAMNKRNIRY